MIKPVNQYSEHKLFGAACIAPAVAVCPPALAQGIQLTTFITESGRYVDLEAHEPVTSSDVGTLVGRMEFNSDRQGPGGQYLLDDLAIAWQLRTPGGLGTHEGGMLQEDDQLWHTASSSRAIVRVLDFDTATGAGEASIALAIGRGDPHGLGELSPRLGVGLNHLSVALGWSDLMIVDPGPEPRSAGVLSGELSIGVAALMVLESPVALLLDSGTCWLSRTAPATTKLMLTASSSIPSGLPVRVEVEPAGAATVASPNVTLEPGQVVELVVAIEEQFCDLRFSATYTLGGQVLQAWTTEVFVGPSAIFHDTAAESSSASSSQAGSVPPVIREGYRKCRSQKQVNPNRWGFGWTEHGDCDFDCVPPSFCAGQGLNEPGYITTRGACYSLSLSTCILVSNQISLLTPYMVVGPECTKGGCTMGRPWFQTVRRWKKMPICLYSVPTGAQPLVRHLRTCVTP